MYLTQADILKRVPQKLLIELTDDTGTGEIDSLKVSTAIEDTCSLIDSYLSYCWVLPLDEFPERIERIAFDITMFFIYCGRYDDKIPEEIRTRYEEALKNLDKIKYGELLFEGSTQKKILPLCTNKNIDELVFSKSQLLKY